MAERKSYDLFIVHAWRYHDDWNRMVELIDTIPDFKWRNFSLPWYDPSIEPHLPEGKARLDKLLEGQIIPAHCVIYVPAIFESKLTGKWRETALDMIRLQGKPVIVVNQTPDALIPEDITPLVRAVTAWDAAELKAAVVKNSL